MMMMLMTINKENAEELKTVGHWQTSESYDTDQRY